ADALVNFASKNTFGNDLVFWSFTSKTKPCSATYIQDGLYEALADMLEEEAHCIGEMVKDKSRLDDEGNPINIRKGEELRKARNLVFHGLRYFFVSQLRGKVNDTTLRLTVGHQSEAMTDHYTQVAYGNLIDMADASRKLFDFPEVEKPSFS
ncbi:MAG: hypothetical protein Q8T08_11480, partial [Ignavibacteria bacterium]|nr:hypothetical protein [Ignavibacteria bacterium]